MLPAPRPRVACCGRTWRIRRLPLQIKGLFDALFGVTEPDVLLRKSFTAQFVVGDANLVGAKLDRGLFQQDVQGNPAPLPSVLCEDTI